MLGRYVFVRVTKPMHSFDAENGIRNELNFGKVENGIDPFSPVKGAYIMGVNHRVRLFEGRVIAVIKRKKTGGIVLVVAPKSKRYIIHEIEDAVSYAEKGEDIEISCFYEMSCGAVVYRIINGELRFLLIKNKRSLNWGFPKGHMERGEDEHMTAYREVLEEAGIRINFLPDFRFKSEYSIQNKIEKTVIIFLASTNDTRTVIQREEIEEYLWLGFEKAMTVLKFPNDKQVLRRANEYLEKAGVTNA